MGVETAIEFLLNFGGAEIHLTTKPSRGGMVERVIGYEKTKRLVEVSINSKHRVPLANKWLAQCLYCQGLSIAAIARRVRRSDTTVRKYLRGTNTPRSMKR
ncbi:helix-turn-helix domain containing protein [Roseobacter denitrificans]|nr:helix-turn-helix domain containing protein [Roseobacter denitrificans]